MLLNQDILREKSNAAENLLTLRRRLKLTQREFIDTYLIDKQGMPLISVSTLSGIENGVQDNVMPLTVSVAAKLGADADVFVVDPDSFAKNIELFFETLSNHCNTSLSAAKSGNTVETLVRALSDYLMDAIISGKLKPGDKLPSDRSLSATYAVGRSSIREALKVLSALGLINILPGQGTFIALEHTDFFLTPLSWTLFIGKDNANHLLEMRTILEMETARLAAEKADEKSLAELGAQFEAMQAAYKSANFQAFLDSDLDFHLAIARCSGNPIIHSLLQTSRKLLSHISKTGMVSMEQLHDIAGEHHAIYTAIAKGDARGAQKQMKAHLERASGRYRL
jgi:DNA-binding FadR family transcriptional regulator